MFQAGDRVRYTAGFSYLLDPDEVYTVTHFDPALFRLRVEDLVPMYSAHSFVKDDTPVIQVGDKVQYRSKHDKHAKILGRGVHTVHAIERGELRSKIAVIRLPDGTDYRIRCAYLSRCASDVLSAGDCVIDRRTRDPVIRTVHSVSTHPDGRQRIRFSEFSLPHFADHYRSIRVDDDTLPLHDVPADENNPEGNTMSADIPRELTFAEKFEANLRAEAECMLEADRLLARLKAVTPGNSMHDIAADSMVLAGRKIRIAGERDRLIEDQVKAFAAELGLPAGDPGA